MPLVSVTIRIATSEGERMAAGYSDPDVPGLALARIPTTRRRVVYSITHMRSGTRVLPILMPRKAALEVLRFLGRAARERGLSWDRSPATLRRHRQVLGPVVREALDMARALTPADVLARELEELEAGWVDRADAPAEGGGQGGL